MIKAVIFDLDGTLGDTLPLCIEAFKKSIEPLAGKKLSDNEIIATFGPSEEGTIQQLIPDHYEQGVKDYLKYYQELHSMSMSPFDGIVELLEYLRSSELIAALVTGKGHKSARITLEIYGISDMFDMVETGWIKGPRKVEGIQAVLAKYNLMPEEAVYIGDTASDIKSARDAGIAIWSAAWSSTANISELQESMPDMIFTEIETLKMHMQKICSSY